MGRVIAFSEFKRYLEELDNNSFVRGSTLDANILISLTYEVKSNYDEVTHFIDALCSEKFELFTTINTRAEFLDFHRRLIMTEYLIDIINFGSTWNLPKTARAQIQSQLGQLRRNEKNGGDPVFSDRQIKKIKSSFSAGSHSGQQGWIKLCDILLKHQLDGSESALNEFGIKYLSQNDPKQANMFHTEVAWSEAKRISEKTCIGIADAMIINAFSSSYFPFMVSTDFDIGYTVLASKNLKDVIVPDQVAKKYRNFHFDKI